MERIHETASMVARVVAAHWRVLALAAVLLAVAGVMAPGQEAAASENQTKQSVEQVCREQGGVFWETEDEYGCWFPDGDSLECDNFLSELEGTLGCVWTDERVVADDPAPEPTPVVRSPAAYSGDTLYLSNE